MDGRGTAHGHCQRRHSHIMRIHFCMTLRPISGNWSSPQLACGASYEHDVVAGWIQGPVVPLARVIIGPGHLHKALVEREVVPDGVLPALLVLTVVREVLHDVVIYTTQGQLSLRAGADSHHYQSIVGEWRLLVLGFFLSTLRVLCLFLVGLLCRALGLSIAGRQGLLQLGSTALVEVCCTLVH